MLMGTEICFVLIDLASTWHLYPKKLMLKLKGMKQFDYERHRTSSMTTLVPYFCILDREYKAFCGNGVLPGTHTATT